MQEWDMGAFIRAKRLERHLTQKQLAEQLGITDKAVSKWERGNSLPDISLLLPLASALGVPAAELLGAMQQPGAPPADVVASALSYSRQVDRQNRRNLRLWLFAGTSAAFLIAALVCWICDMALNKALTWSLLVDSSLVLSWLVLLPLFLARRHPLPLALAVLSAGILPYLYFLRVFLRNPLIFRLGLPIAPASVLFAWCVYAVCRMLRRRKWLAASAVLALAVPLDLFIDFVTARQLGGQMEFGSCGITLLLAAACLLAEYLLRQRPADR